MRGFTLTAWRLEIRYVVIGLLLGACSREDLSQYLASGKCDEQGLCAAGYECQASTWQCLKAGQVADAAGQAPDAPSPPTVDARSVEADVGDSKPDLRTLDGPVPTPPDACPPGGCLCGEGLSNCGGECVDLRKDDKHCGSCTGACVLGTVNLACGTFTAGACDCAGDDARCGSAASPGQCTPTTGLCVCGGTTCARGEICQADSTGRSACSCDGLTACNHGMTCCLGYGCADLNTQSDHCGGCGKSCPKLHYCQAGSCRCRNDKACDAGASGVCTSQGYCQCDSVLCAPGLRCVAAGVCG